MSLYGSIRLRALPFIARPVFSSKKKQLSERKKRHRLFRNRRQMSIMWMMCHHEHALIDHPTIPLAVKIVEQLYNLQADYRFQYCRPLYVDNLYNLQAGRFQEEKL